MVPLMYVLTKIRIVNADQEEVNDGDIQQNQV
jgi:hypothetical protein